MLRGWLSGVALASCEIGVYVEVGGAGAEALQRSLAAWAVVSLFTTTKITRITKSPKSTQTTNAYRCLLIC